MDASAVNVNVTIDDFDSVLSYADQSVWVTPDPSNPTFDDTNSPWFMGTYHKTETVDATLSLNFTGPAIYIYGHAGPSYGSYEVQIDSNTSSFSAHAESNASTPHLLYSANLPYSAHTLTLRNLGAKDGDAGGNSFLVDYIQITMQVAPAGATASNTTYEEDNTALTYSGKWGNNTGPDFSGGGTAFTNEDKASVSLSFHGSAIYLFGDKKNDHGLYSVVLDNQTPVIHSGISGCGGAFSQTCEQQKPTLQFIAHNLDDSLHTIKIENLAGVNNSFLDIDSFVVTVPSAYSVRDLSGSSSSSASGSGSSSTSSATGTTSASPSGTNNNSNAASSMSPWNPLLFLVLAVFWLVRPSLRR
ncbi:hypothetical protein BDQ12DRAFT_668015 [Crucibulum laeve]|uniref:Uncharacterized protein n=1 Tax=Crucibulum laeve TaxID=68775 RepID=A0A5C3LS93_9AGAR|nr:hypothetical protein BDQ12DRAFT_668015 [Crucibulum laeve]